MKSLQEKIQFVKDFLSELPSVDNKEIKIEDVKYGVVDKFLMDKSNPDKNGFYSNSKIIQRKFDSIKDFVEFAKSNFSANKDKTLIAYKPLNDKYHFQLVKIFNCKKSEDFDKYLILVG